MNSEGQPSQDLIHTLFSLDAKVAIVTGGTGVLGSAMAKGLAGAGARVGVLGRRQERAEAVVQDITHQGGEATALHADVLNEADLRAARDLVLARWGRIDILVNAAGGNVPEAIVDERRSFFSIPRGALEEVLDLNLLGTVLPCQVFGAVMAEQTGTTAAGAREGCIVNISSMSAKRALTRVVGYSAAKAAVENFTRWLAVDLARTHGSGLRVNALAPGFFLGEQNRDLLMHADSTLTERGRTIIEQTPAGRFGVPDDLIATLIWLCSPGASYVNGVVVSVDGGFDAFSGV